MPQLDQLPEFFWSQLFWLAVVFGILFFVIGRSMLPKIEATVDARDAKVTDDLAAAQRAREQADEIETDYRARIDAGRAEALRAVQASKQDAAREAETRVKAADAELAATTGAAEERIQAASASALGEIESLSAEFTQELVAKLAGLKVNKESATRAVKAAIHG